MTSKLLTVTVALTQILIENLDTLEQYGICQRKLKQTGKNFHELLLKQNEHLFKNLTDDTQYIFFKEVEFLEEIIKEYQAGNLKVIKDCENNL